MGEVLEHLRQIEQSQTAGRGIGKTSALVEAAKKIGATFVCHNSIHAKNIQKEYDIKAISLFDNIRGTQEPYIYDHHTVEVIASEAAGQIESLTKELAKLRAAYDDGEKYCEAVEKQLNAEKDKVGFALYRLERISETFATDAARSVYIKDTIEQIKGMK